MEKTTLTPKQDRSRRTEKALLRALESLLAHKSLEQISVAEIAQEAGLTTGAIYRRFRDKRGLLIASVNRGIEQFEALQTAKPVNYAPGVSDDQLVMNLIQDYFDIAFDNLRNLQAVAHVRHDQTFTRILEGRAAVATWFAGLLQTSPHSKEGLTKKVAFVLRIVMATFMDTLRLMEPGTSKEQFLADNQKQLERVFAELHMMSCLYLGVAMEPK